MTAPWPGRPGPPVGPDGTAPLAAPGGTAPLPGAPGVYGPPSPPVGYPPPGYGPPFPLGAGFPPGPPYPPGAYFPPGPPGPPPGPAGPRNGFGVTALACGLIGALLGFVIYAFVMTAILGVVAVVFGGLGLARTRRGEATNTGVAVTGTVLGLIACVAAVLGAVAVVHRVSHGVGKIGNYVQCVNDIPSTDPQYDTKVQDCLHRFG